MKLRKEGKLKEFLNNFIAISLNMPQGMRNMNHAREIFREEKKKDLKFQLFDITTIYHHLALAYWSNQDYENARINFEESKYYRDNYSHYLDKFSTYGNLSAIYSKLDDSHNAILLLLNLLNELILNKGEEVDLINNYLLMCDLYIIDKNYKNAIIMAEKCIELANRYNMINELNMAKVKIERCNTQMNVVSLSHKKIDE
ncbi:MAG: hypothetical protein INQ03_06295 [Candidatus Heimdallarchaeota archaeon]|nr:hypothetical protein [Candidatus Heimdallarchaeota archaeon]